MIRSSRKVRSASLVRVPRVHVPVGELALDDVRLDDPLDHVSSPSFWYWISTSRWSRIAAVNVPIRRSSSFETRGRRALRQVELAERLLELQPDAVERRVHLGRRPGPTNSSARRIARASSGVRRGDARNVSP